jgi:polyhydroxyalkanoate synthase
MVDPLAVIGELALRFEGAAQLERVRRGMWIHAHAPRPPVGLTPHAIVHAHDKLVVRYYAPALSHARREPVLLVPSMINRAYILDLEPGRSVVEALAGRGHPTYLVDWGTPGPEDAAEDVGYVLLELLHRSIGRVARHAGAARVHLFGYCQGGTLAAMYAALRPAQVASLCTLAAPVKFAAGGRFRDLVAGIDVDRAIDADGLVPVDVMKPAFKLLDPMGNWNKFLGLEAASKDPARLASAMRRERWLDDNVPMAGAFAREFIDQGYHRDRLITGEWRIRGERVDLANIACRSLVIACDNDFITPKAAALPLVNAIGGGRARAEVLATGHIGVVVSSAAPKVFHPLLDRWFREATA